MTDRASGSRLEQWRHRLRRLALLPVRYEVQHAAAPPNDSRVCYVLETERSEDRWVFEAACLAAQWPVPKLGFATDTDCGLVTLWHAQRWYSRRTVPRDLSELGACFELDAQARDDVSFVPVAVFWGRAPGREQSWLRLWSSEGWGLTGRLRRLFAVLLHGRDVLVKVGEPITVADLADEDPSPARMQRKLGRVLRVFFQQQRTATVGPDLSHRRLLLEEVLDSPLVSNAIRREVRAKPRVSENKIRKRASRYAREIAADYSYPVVRMLDRAFTWLWNKLYDGVQIRHLESLSEIAAGSEIVYVPCHRSHIDYMLLAYVIYRNGLAPPHIAAGVNLNIPIVGQILRRGGAFFLRRSMHGNALYAAVFRSYFRTILARGFPVKYFIEGTRSRTGRLLKPKLGLLTMTIEAYLANPQRPIVFVPVYFGYEKLLEGQTFLGELRGQRKKQETLGSFLRSLKALRERFGSVQVSFAEPIALSDLLDQQRPGWREVELEEPFRPQWLTQAAQVLGNRILTAINDAAAVNAVNLVSLVTLCMPKQAIVEIELKTQVEMYLALLHKVPYGPRASVDDSDADTMIGECEALGWLTRRQHALGDVLSMDERTAVLASYYRNNVVHVFAMPALLAAVFSNRSDLSLAQIADLVIQLHPCLRNELYLSLGEDEIDAEIARLSEAMLELGLLERTPGRLSRPASATAQLALCAQIVLPYFERYYLGVTVLLGQGAGALSRRDLIRRCSDAAEQLSLIYALNSPDLFQANLFDNFVSYLEDAQLLYENAEGRLAFDEGSLNELAVALGFVLPPQLKRTLINLAGLAAATPSDREAVSV